MNIHVFYKALVSTLLCLSVGASARTVSGLVYAASATVAQHPVVSTSAGVAGGIFGGVMTKKAAALSKEIKGLEARVREIQGRALRSGAVLDSSVVADIQKKISSLAGKRAFFAVLATLGYIAPLALGGMAGFDYWKNKKAANGIATLVGNRSKEQEVYRMTWPTGRPKTDGGLAVEASSRQNVSRGKWWQENPLHRNNTVSSVRNDEKGSDESGQLYRTGAAVVARSVMHPVVPMTDVLTPQPEVAPVASESEVESAVQPAAVTAPEFLPAPLRSVSPAPRGRAFSEVVAPSSPNGSVGSVRSALSHQRGAPRWTNQRASKNERRIRREQGGMVPNEDFPPLPSRRGSLALFATIKKPR